MPFEADPELDAPRTLKCRIVVDATLCGNRLDRVLTQAICSDLGVSWTWAGTGNNCHDSHKNIVPPRPSREIVRRWIVDGCILKEGEARICRPSQTASAGEIYWAEIPRPCAVDLTPEAMELDVVFEDPQIIVLNKSAGVVVHPAPGHRYGTLVQGVLHRCGDLAGIGGVLRPGVVHRLDRHTSGLIVMAKTDAAHQDLTRQFADRSVGKVYRAWVWGNPKPRGRIETLYGRDPNHRIRFSSQVKAGKTAITHYSVQHSSKGFCELEVSLETGRTHQIRVHFADQRHPLLGDPLYGGATPMRASIPELRAAVLELPGQALHAEHLTIRHPTKGDMLQFSAPLPGHLARLAALIRNQSLG